MTRNREEFILKSSVPYITNLSQHCLAKSEHWWVVKFCRCILWCIANLSISVGLMIMPMAPPQLATQTTDSETQSHFSNSI